VRFPIWVGRCGHAVEEVARRHGDFAIAGACVSVEVTDSIVQRCGIGLFGLESTPVRASTAEQSVIGSPVTSVDPASLGQAAVGDLVSIPSDLNGSASYRRRVGATVVMRAWATAIEEALHD
jgi:carbon-monoxide dehydrogenase medium subunit